MSFWLTVFEQFAPWVVMLWFARRTALQMRFLERQLEHLAEATARVSARETNTTPPEPLPEPEPQPLPTARASFRR